MSGPPAGATPPAPWRRLGSPEAFASGPAQIAALIGCSLLVAGIGALDAALAPTVTLGTLLLIVVLAGTWTLSGPVSAIVALEAMAAPVVATRVGDEPAAAAEIKVAAIALAAVIVRFTVQALKTSERALRERGDDLARALLRVEQSRASLERFTGDAAHELRRPLALMQSEIDVALSADRIGPAAHAHLARIAEELRRMRDITDSLLLLAQADAGALDLSASARDLDIVDFFEATLSRWHEVAVAQGSRLVQHLPEEGRLPGDADLLARVVDNLLDNALRHTGSARTVTVTVERRRGDWEIAVADDGPGVPEALRDRLFERFARGEESHAKGTGLGLALAAAIVEAHRGTLRLESGTERGARFLVTLPAEAPEPTG